MYRVLSFCSEGRKPSLKYFPPLHPVLKHKRQISVHAPSIQNFPRLSTSSCLSHIQLLILDSYTVTLPATAFLSDKNIIDSTTTDE